MFPDVATFVESWTTTQATPPIKILDTSRHNHGLGALEPIDFEQVKAAGYTVWCGRASVGNYYIDPWFQRDYDAAKAAGLICLAYHVTVPVHDDASQVAKFLEALGGREPVGVVIDAEWNYTPSSPARCTECNEYHADEFEDLPWGPRVLFYTNQNYANNYLLTDFGLPLWVANPGVGLGMNTNPEPAMPRWWSDWFMWQKDWRHVIPGVPDTTADYSEWNARNIHTPESYFGIEEPPMSDPILLARIVALEERVTAIELGTPPPPPPPVEPPDEEDTIIVKAKDKDKTFALAWFAKSWRDANVGPDRPLMEIYPSESSLSSERIKFNNGTELAVVLPKVKADGGAYFYQLRDRKGRAGETLYVRDTDASLA